MSKESLFVSSILSMLLDLGVFGFCTKELQVYERKELQVYERNLIFSIHNLLHDSHRSNIISLVDLYFHKLQLIFFSLNLETGLVPCNQWILIYMINTFEPQAMKITYEMKLGDWRDGQIKLQIEGPPPMNHVRLGKKLK